MEDSLECYICYKTQPVAECIDAWYLIHRKDDTGVEEDMYLCPSCYDKYEKNG